MIRTKFALELSPESWIGDISRSFPGTRFRLLTGITIDDRAVELGEVVGDRVAAADEAVETHPAVVEHERLYVDDERALAKYWTTDQELYEFLRASSVPPEFPIVVEDGWAELEVTAPREQVRGLFSALDRGGPDYEVLAMAEPADPDTLLTDRQRELLEIAVEEGYFRVPRDCTLADVAERAGVDASTASGVLRRGEGRLVTWFLTGSGGTG